jgi:hypothetical protein
VAIAAANDLGFYALPLELHEQSPHGAKLEIVPQEAGVVCTIFTRYPHRSASALSGAGTTSQL